MMESLTPERFRELWSRTYNIDGKPDWSNIYPYQYEDVIFEDSSQHIDEITSRIILAALKYEPVVSVPIAHQSKFNKTLL